MRFEPDSWLASLFGHAVYKVSLSDAPPPADLTFVSQGARAFHYVRVPTRSVDAVRMLVCLGFSVIDVSMTFEREPGGSLAGALNIDVGEARPDEYPALLDIAGSSFVYSRFHLDTAVEHRVADAVKREWVKSYTERRRGERLIAARVEGHLAGFLAERAADEHGHRVGWIDLLGVGTAWQRRGVGSAMTAWWVAAGAGRYSTLRVGTQVANVPSIRMYERLGFTLKESAYVLHAHVRDGRVVRRPSIEPRRQA